MIILAAGYATRLYPLTENFPKPLLKIGNSTILDRLIKDVERIQQVTEFIIVTNNKYYPHFENWVQTINTTKKIHILNDGTNTN